MLTSADRLIAQTITFENDTPGRAAQGFRIRFGRGRGPRWLADRQPHSAAGGKALAQLSDENVPAPRCDLHSYRIHQWRDHEDELQTGLRSG